MKSNKEMMAESFRRVTAGKWFFRTLAVMAFFGAANNTANMLVDAAYRRHGLQTWFDFLLNKAQAMSAGLDYAVPSRAVASQMNGATAFMLFIALIFAGILLFAVTSVMLKAARDDDSRWFRDSFGGALRPLDVAWLGFLLFARIAFWSLFLVVPGVVATYRFSQCWNVKVENPDWGALKCMRESMTMMAGYKWRRFQLDASILGAVLAAVVPLGLAAAVLSALGGGAAQAAGAVCSLAATAALVIGSMWLSASRAVFYRELKDARRGNMV